ncbi:MAG: glutamate formimidoyltransferase [Nitrospiraceae bacterium]
MDRLVECVPNFSEGRNEETLQALAAAVTAVPQVVLLDQQRDWDHHRAVLTFAGAPDAVAEAAVAMARVAVERIDLRQHQGVHPRIGATDVLPFVPLRGVTMKDCVELARHVGARIGAELGIPVFLYEQAAKRPERSTLAHIRRGGLDGLAVRMRDPAWAPDFGPPRLHPTAGATVVGARPMLIAYNVNLQSTDIAVAKAIAETVRQSSGGLPHVKAIGVALPSRGRVQVSMNLTNHEETPIHVAFEAVRTEAARRHVQIVGSEVIGLVPQRALLRAAAWALKLEEFHHNQVLETKLESELTRRAQMQRPVPETLAEVVGGLRPFLDAVSVGSPTPAGGSVASLAGALACSLGIMACRIGPPANPRESGRSADEPEVDNLQATEQRLIELRRRLEGLIQADAEAYGQFLRATQLPKTDQAREAAVASGLHGATQVSLETVELACEAAALLHSLTVRVRPSVGVDLKVALMMALASAGGAVLNAEENLKSLKKQTLAVDSQGKLQKLKERLVDIQRL